MTLLLAAIMCTTVLYTGSHPLECTAEYVHTLPDGTQYYDSITEGVWVPVLPGTIGYTAECSGEGHPERVTMKDMGMVVCMEEKDLFSDGLESGDTSAWSNASH